MVAPPVWLLQYVWSTPTERLKWSHRTPWSIDGGHAPGPGVLPRAKYFPDQLADDFDGPIDDDEGEAAKAGMASPNAPTISPARSPAAASEQSPLDLISAALPALHRP